MKSAEMLSSLMDRKAHPILRETMRECLEDYWDLEGVEYVLNGIRSGNIRLLEMYLDTASPMSLPLRHRTEASMMYDYAPTTENIQNAAAEALKQVSLVPPDPEQLDLAARRTKLPENEQQLHSLLMIEGDLAAGELDIPVQWLESLAASGHVRYIEPGLWIAAEHEKEYSDALEGAASGPRKRLVQRLLRYRGAKSLEQVAERYLWTDETALEVLSLLCEQGDAVRQDGVYYHSRLYDRAREATIKNRRRQVTTQPAERYAALLASRMRTAAPSSHQLEEAIGLLNGLPYPAEAWENIILSARVANYRPELMDAMLSGGTVFWQMGPGSELCFHRSGDIDWEADLSEIRNGLEGSEKILYEALLKYGASFMQRLEGLTGGSPYDPLLNLASKGLVTADSFAPVRQWLNRARIQKSPARQRVNIRTKSLSTGRWEVVRPLKALTVEELLNRSFDRSVILCRETIHDMDWSTAL
jgi:ATP-dependent Lhr-like helicase